MCERPCTIRAGEIRPCRIVLAAALLMALGLANIRRLADRLIGPGEIRTDRGNRVTAVGLILCPISTTSRAPHRRVHKHRATRGRSHNEGAHSVGARARSELPISVLAAGSRMHAAGW